MQGYNTCGWLIAFDLYSIVIVLDRSEKSTRRKIGVFDEDQELWIERMDEAPFVLTAS